MDAVTDGGMEAFKAISERNRMHQRQIAISHIRKIAAGTGKATIIAGHLMFWPEDDEIATAVYTQDDLETYTHIIYLDVPANVIVQRSRDDMSKVREAASVSHLEKWQCCEKQTLRQVRREHGILFMSIESESTAVDRVAALLHDFCRHDEQHNDQQAMRLLDNAVANSRQSQDYLHTMLVLDGEKTLAAEDGGELFWSRLRKLGLLNDDDDPLKTLFGSGLGYSYKAFRQATLLYEEVASEEEFDIWCKDVASAVTMHPEFKSLLHQVVQRGSGVGAIIVTCGLRRVWEKVLEKEGLSSSIKVIGGRRIADGLVITPSVKAAVVDRLQKAHHQYV